MLIGMEDVVAHGIMEQTETANCILGIEAFTALFATNLEIALVSSRVSCLTSSM